MISFKKAIAFLLALLMTLGILPSGTALAAENTSVTIKLAAIQGDVRIMVGETPFKTPKVDMRLMDGSSILTGEKSYASLEMDDSKFATVDQNSEVKIKKSGKTNEILISSGSVFFNVTKPLENEETMRVKTSNITMSVRGTIGVNIARTVYDEQGNPVSVSSETQIYEGVGVVTTIGGTAAAPGASATYEVRPGQSLITTTTLSTGTTTVTQNEIGTDGAGIPAVALEQMVASPELANRVSAATGLDVAQLPDALVQAQEAEQQEQQQTKEALTGAQNQFQAENQPQIAPAPAIPEEAIKSAQDQQGVGSGKDVTTPPPPTIPSGGGGGVTAKTVATIGNTRYTDIGKAFNELGSGQTLTVLEDCATTANITLPAGSLLVINNTIKLTINGSFTNRGLVTLGASATLSGYNFQTPEAPGMFHLGMGSRLVSVQGAVLRDKAGNPTAELMSNEADGWVIWKQNTGWQHALTGDALSTSTGITVPEKGVGYVPLGKTLALQAGKQNRVDGTLVMDGWFTLANPLGDNTLVVGADGRVLGSAAANGFFGTDGTTPLPLPIAAGSYIGVSRDGKVAFKLSQDEDQGGEQTETTVAQIGDLHYESVDEALATLESGEELVVYRSANLTEVQRIPESATLIIKSHEGVPAVLAVLEPVSLTNLGRIEVCEGAALRVLGALLNGQTNTNSSQVDVVGAGSTLEMSRASTFASNAFLRLRDGGRVTCDAAIFYDAAGENPVQEMTSAGSVIYLFPRITVGLQLPLRLEDIINQNPISVGAGSIAYVPPGEGITIRGKGNRVDGRLIMHGQMRYEALDAEITIAPGAIVSGYGAQMTFYDNDSGWLAPPIAEGTYLADDNVDGIGSPGFVKQSDGGEQTQTTVAQIGDLHYESIDKALAELKSGEELVVYRNASLTKDCAVPQNATVTLEGLEGVSAILTVPITLTNNGAIAITNRCTLEASGSLVNNGIISVDGLDANVVNADHITPSSNGSLWVSQGGHMIAGTAIFYDELGESAVEEVNPTYDETSDWYYLPLIDGGKGWQLTLRGEALSHPDRGLSVGEKTIGYVMLSEMLTVYPGHDNSVEGRLVVEGGMYYPEAGTKFIIANDAEVKGTGVQNMFYDQDGNALPTPIPAGTYIASDEAGGAERPGLVKQSDVVGPEPTPDPNSVARVGSDYYTTLHEAIAAAENVGDEVIVTKSCSLTEEAALESGVKLTIGADSKGTPVTVSLEATLTCDGVIELGLGGQLEGTERISRNGFYSVMSLRGGTASASTPVFTDKDGNGPVNEVTGEDDDYVYAAFSFEPSKWQCALKQDEFVTDGSMDVPQGSTAVIRTGETVILKEGGTNVVEGTLIILDDKDVHGVLTAAATEVPVVIGETGGIGCTGKNLIFYTLQQGGNAGSVEFFRFALKGSYLSRLADDGSGYIFEKMTTE